MPAESGKAGSDEAERESLLEGAAKCWGEVAQGEAARSADPSPGGPFGVEDVPGFLREYYRLVATEDLAPAGPGLAAAVAARHARLGAYRPQGRAVVNVGPADSETTITDASTVVDIVTDDMPYLVDSVTMALNQHSADVKLIVHPLLTVRRDVAGQVLGVIGTETGVAGTRLAGPVAAEAAPGTVAESWIHVEAAGIADDDRLAADLRQVLDDVRVAMEDQRRMRGAARELVATLADAALTATWGPEEAEAGELLAWLSAGHFTFLGYREYDLSSSGDAATGELRPLPGSGLGLLRHDGVDAFTIAAPGGMLSGRAARRLVLAKSSLRSTVYRPSYLDYVAVRKFDAEGQVTGEYRFLGLYTQAAYTESITRIPVLRQKLNRVLDAAGLPADSHDGKELVEILEGYPREELFEISAEQLAPIALGVLRLGERKQVRVFLRPDAYGRYMSCLVYLPRDRYTTEVRLRAQEILRAALDGGSVDYSAMVSNSALARLHVTVQARPGTPIPPVADIDEAALQARIAAATRSWDEDLMEGAGRALGTAVAERIAVLGQGGIPDNYKADVPAADAVADLAGVARLKDEGRPFALHLSLPDKGERQVRLRIYRADAPLTLSDVLPQLQHMGLEVVEEHPYQFGGSFWIYDFGLRRVGDRPLAVDADTAAAEFEATLTALWEGQTEDDGFNALVLDAGLNWHQVVVLRAYARYLRQAGLRFSQDYVQRVLLANPRITRLLVRLFEARFDPGKQDAAAEVCAAFGEELRGRLDEVTSLDHDRILRAYLALVEATLRTSYYQLTDGAPASYLALKLATGSVEIVPAPRPKFEIFVYSPRLEAVHLRFGHVARGGLRWSERPEDFRTEVLGLVKAQEVKNSVIVPSGAKGGFVCKMLPDPADREAYQAEVLACYKTFIAAMLDITDNIAGDAVLPPQRVVRLDGDDPYLVVAADKGTASFSDVANAIAESYGYWLGDAFASGGSQGYDHKAMGITARGAWESVRWHFAALRINPETDDFTVVGVGDMSGDVFGNGMLLSPHIKLVAAFDHRHVFLDPAPDPASSFAERQRLFGLPRSSWADYDHALISAGGGIWPRSAKSIPLGEPARAALGLEPGVTALSPDEVISAILAAPVDLLWNGGIGTYVKASWEAQADAGDRSNDAVRISAPQLRCKVIGEGGNLGFTQAARIEFARAGGLVNTDFIDNSAGVDTSDHEVNIKILLADAIASGVIGAGDRPGLLHAMTDEVAAHVLAHNDAQNNALAVARFQAPRLLHVHARYIRKMVREGQVSLAQDGLPADKEAAERRSAGGGLTAPELSVLLAHTKNAAAAAVLAADLPDDPYLRADLARYFPGPLRTRFATAMDGHRLRREIITTSVVNEMVDTSGITFLFRLAEETGASVPELTRAWLVAREAFGMAAFWQALAGTSLDVDARIAIVLEARKLVERATRWLVVNRRPPFDIESTVESLRPGVAAVRAGIPRLLAGRDLETFTERRSAFVARGVPAALAGEVAAMVPSYSACDIVHSADRTGSGVEETAAVYFALADRLQVGRLKDLIVALPRDDRWSSMARSALRDDLFAAHAALTRDVVASGTDGPAGKDASVAERLAAWEARNSAAIGRTAATLAEIWEGDQFTFTTMSVASRVIRTLVTSTTASSGTPEVP
ncbi:MAG TPA: NAD-glutamate dehydrogenase [Trebonia sp.]|jgi:glutamate dehydrogenase|nr:NAD-glutamate dehydrogenase [Trebonia sp.]